MVIILHFMTFKQVRNNSKVHCRNQALALPCQGLRNAQGWKQWRCLGKFWHPSANSCCRHYIRKHTKSSSAVKCTLTAIRHKALGQKAVSTVGYGQQMVRSHWSWLFIFWGREWCAQQQWQGDQAAYATRCKKYPFWQKHGGQGRQKMQHSLRK